MDRGAGHQPVLLDAVATLLAPAGRRVLVDCTIGLGGHAETLMELAGPEGLLIGIDFDEGNLKAAVERLARFGPRVRLFQANFRELDEVLRQAGLPAADAILADLGVASNQLDDPSRGLSFATDAPLDMRLDRRSKKTASVLVNHLDETELANLIYEYGEERYSRRIAQAIVSARRKKPMESTVELAKIIAQAMPAPVRRARRGVHPATRTFQALRIAVNDELGNLERLLGLLPSALAVGGRAAIISFHSLEDRRVKHSFADWAKTGRASLLTKKPVMAAAAEMAANPRSRSAKLRGIERVA
jgi:16S rRNA (cytosine1402-N4)-methyltransferase